MVAKNIDYSFTIVAGKVDFSADGEALLGDKNGAEMLPFLLDAERPVFVKMMEDFSLGEAVSV